MKISGRKKQIIKKNSQLEPVAVVFSSSKFQCLINYLTLMTIMKRVFSRKKEKENKLKLLLNSGQRIFQFQTEV